VPVRDDCQFSWITMRVTIISLVARRALCGRERIETLFGRHYFFKTKSVGQEHRYFLYGSSVNRPSVIIVERDKS